MPMIEESGINRGHIQRKQELGFICLGQKLNVSQSNSLVHDFVFFSIATKKVAWYNGKTVGFGGRLP